MHCLHKLVVRTVWRRVKTAGAVRSSNVTADCYAEYNKLIRQEEIADRRKERQAARAASKGYTNKWLVSSFFSKIISPHKLNPNSLWWDSSLTTRVFNRLLY